MIPPPFHTVPPLKGAAVETWIDEVSKRIISYEMHIISIGSNYLAKNSFSEGVYYHRITFSKIYKRIFQNILGWDVHSYNKRVINIIKEVNPDLVHIHNYRDANEIIKWLKKFRPDVKILYHMHNRFEGIEENIAESDCFVVCSRALEKEYTESRDPDKKTRVLYNGADTERFENIFYKNRKYIRKRFTPEHINVCYFGRLSPEKGADKFIELAEMLKEDSRFMFYCIGEIPAHSLRRKFYTELVKRVRKKI